MPAPRQAPPLPAGLQTCLRGVAPARQGAQRQRGGGAEMGRQPHAWWRQASGQGNQGRPGPPAGDGRPSLVFDSSVTLSRVAIVPPSRRDPCCWCTCGMHPHCGRRAASAQKYVRQVAQAGGPSPRAALGQLVAAASQTGRIRGSAGRAQAGLLGRQEGGAGVAWRAQRGRGAPRAHPAGRAAPFLRDPRPAGPPGLTSRSRTIT